MTTFRYSIIEKDCDVTTFVFIAEKLLDISHFPDWISDGF